MNERIKRLFYFSIAGIIFSIYLVLENIITKHNYVWQYVIAGILLVFSIIFLIGRKSLNKKTSKK